MSRLIVTFGCVLVLALVAGCRDSRGVDSDDCTSDDDCLSDEYCAEGSCALISDASYASCVDTSDCVTGTCVEVTTTGGTSGAFCSFGCSADADCPSRDGYSGACFDPSLDGSFICFQRCDVNDDCAFGSSCYEVELTTGFIDFVCIPD